VGWEIDGRKGSVWIGSANRKGFAMMRDSTHGLIAFHAFPDERFEPDQLEWRGSHQYLIAERDFEPAPPSPA
jgi:hypothetical protein